MIESLKSTGIFAIIFLGIGFLCIVIPLIIFYIVERIKPTPLPDIVIVDPEVLCCHSCGMRLVQCTVKRKLVGMSCINTICDKYGVDFELFTVPIEKKGINYG